MLPASSIGLKACIPNPIPQKINARNNGARRLKLSDKGGVNRVIVTWLVMPSRCYFEMHSLPGSA